MRPAQPAQQQEPSETRIDLLFRDVTATRVQEQSVQANGATGTVENPPANERRRQGFKHSSLLRQRASSFDHRALPTGLATNHLVVI